MTSKVKSALEFYANADSYVLRVDENTGLAYSVIEVDDGSLASEALTELTTIPGLRKAIEELDAGLNDTNTVKTLKIVKEAARKYLSITEGE